MGLLANIFAINTPKRGEAYGRQKNSLQKKLDARAVGHLREDALGEPDIGRRHDACARRVGMAS